MTRCSTAKPVNRYRFLLPGVGQGMYKIGENFRASCNLESRFNTEIHSSPSLNLNLRSLLEVKLGLFGLDREDAEEDDENDGEDEEAEEGEEKA